MAISVRENAVSEEFEGGFFLREMPLQRRAFALHLTEEPLYPPPHVFCYLIWIKGVVDFRYAM